MVKLSELQNFKPRKRRYKQKPLDVDEIEEFKEGGYKRLLEMDIVEIYQEIEEVPGDTLFEKIISYAELQDVDTKFIGDILADYDPIKQKLEEELREMHRIV